MHATCPSCRTTYRVPAPYRGRRRPTFECSACGHVFEPAASEADWDDDEPFVMDDEDARRQGEMRGDVAPPEDFGDDEDEEMEIGDDGDDDVGEIEEPEDVEADADEEPVAAAGRRARRGTKRGADRRTPRSPARFALRCLLATVLVYGTVGIYVTTFPESSRAAMERIPLIGTSLARTPLGLAQIALGDVEATLQPLAGAGDGPDALIVVATATNHAAVAAEQIDLAIELEGADGNRQAERRTCTGTVLNVSPFKRGELELMAGYNDARVARIKPGESATCQSIFLDYPADLRSVRVRVVGAQGR